MRGASQGGPDEICGANEAGAGVGLERPGGEGGDSLIISPSSALGRNEQAGAALGRPRRGLRSARLTRAVSSEREEEPATTLATPRRAEARREGEGREDKGRGRLARSCVSGGEAAATGRLSLQARGRGQDGRLCGSERGRRIRARPGGTRKRRQSGWRTGRHPQLPKAGRPGRSRGRARLVSEQWCVYQARS